MLTKPRDNVCQICGRAYVKQRMGQQVCSPQCAAKVGKAERRAERVKTKERKEKMKSRGEWLKEAKTAMQKLRRLQELAKGRGCMSCGRSQAEVMGGADWQPGGFWDGGHFLSKGAYPELALEPKNIWLQCKKCNAGSSKYARKGFTVNQSFRANLSAWEGEALVEWLEGPHPLKHYSVDELITIKLTCNASIKDLKSAQ